MMTDEFFSELKRARESGVRCCLATVAETRGSVPRAAGAKMLVHSDGQTFGTIGGGKLEALVVEAALAALVEGAPVLKSYPLHEDRADSFGAICGGEVTILLEPQGPRERLVIVGAGHCGRAIARLASECGLHVTVLDDRTELLTDFSRANQLISDRTAAEFIAQHAWSAGDALVIVSRNYELDRVALAAALQKPAIGYLGMIGSRRKVRRVFEQLQTEDEANRARLTRVFAPIGLDIGADSPAEIAVSVLAEIFQVLRKRTGANLRGTAVG
jgi:xanthine dehydrogenase accessory factor